MVVHIYINDKRSDQTCGPFREGEEAQTKIQHYTVFMREFQECINFILIARCSQEYVSYRSYDCL